MNKVILCLTLLLSCTLQAQGTRTIELTDLDNLASVSDPRLSPDGNWIVYTVSTVDQEKDTDISNLWLSSWDGKETRQLTFSKANISNPRWSANGRYVAYLSDRDDKNGLQQAWLLDGHGGEPRKISSFAGGVSELAWSPDSKQLLLVVSVDNSNTDDAPRPIVIDRYYFKEDGTGYLETARTHLFLLDIDSQSSVQLTHGPYDEMLPSWPPDGSRIAFVTKRGEDFDRHSNWDIYLTEPRSGAVQQLLTRNPGTDCEPSWCAGSPPAWHPAGDRLSYIRGGDPNLTWFALQQVATIDIADDESEKLPTLSLDRNTLNPHWSENGKALYFILEENLDQALAKIELRSGKVTRLTQPGRVVSHFDVGADNRIVLLSSTANKPYEVGVIDKGKYRALHDHNPWLKDIDLGTTESISFTSKDGTAIDALLVKPANYREGERYPLIMNLHGGPVSQHAHDFHFDWQLLAANGYLVVAPNPRGSSGKGLDFQKAIISDWGNLDVDDVLASVDYLVNRGIADPERLALYGWSYGGMLTNYVIASDSRFAAAVSGAGVSNMLAGYGTDMYIRDWNIELGAPWENLDAWLKVSYPFYNADRITTPTLFMCGELDFNVPLIHSEQMYQALRQLNIPTQLVIYPDEYHSFNRPSFREDEVARHLDWFDTYLSAQ